MEQSPQHRRALAHRPPPPPPDARVASSISSLFNFASLAFSKPRCPSVACAEDTAWGWLLLSPGASDAAGEPHACLVLLRPLHLRLDVLDLLLRTHGEHATKEKPRTPGVIRLRRRRISRRSQADACVLRVASRAECSRDGAGSRAVTKLSEGHGRSRQSFSLRN